MNIGIDLDGVVFDTESLIKVASVFFNYDIGGQNEQDPEEQIAQKRYNWTKEQENEFLNKYLLKISKIAPVMPYAKMVLKWLKKSGHNIYAITSRGNVFEKEITVTKKRLKKEKIKFDKVFYYASNKFEVCKQQNIDLMIDDYYDNIVSLAKNGIKCFYFRDLRSKPYENPNVKEVRNWGDIYVELKKMGA